MTTGNGFITGKVKFFNARKGFGFIKRDDGEADVFLSVNKVPKDVITLHPDARCRFRVVAGREGKGPAADEFSLL